MPGSFAAAFPKRASTAMPTAGRPWLRCSRGGSAESPAKHQCLLAKSRTPAHMAHHSCCRPACFCIPSNRFSASTHADARAHAASTDPKLTKSGIVPRAKKPPSCALCQVRPGLPGLRGGHTPSPTEPQPCTWEQACGVRNINGRCQAMTAQARRLRIRHVDCLVQSVNS